MKRNKEVKSICYLSNFEVVTNNSCQANLSQFIYLFKTKKIHNNKIINYLSNLN